MAFQNWFAANTTRDLGLHVLTLDHVFTELFADWLLFSLIPAIKDLCDRVSAMRVQGFPETEEEEEL
jgi:hypothetical protein